MTDLSIAAILSTCAQYGVTFSTKEEKLCVRGDTKKIGDAFRRLIRIKILDGSILSFLKANPLWKPGVVPTAIRRQVEPDAGPMPGVPPLPPEPSTAQENSPVQKNQGLFPGGLEKSVHGPAPATAAPSPATAAAPPAPVVEPPATSAPATIKGPPMPVRRVGIRSEGPGRDLSKDPWQIVAQCWPCNMEFYLIDRQADPDPQRCLRCGGYLVGPNAKPAQFDDIPETERGRVGR